MTRAAQIGREMKNRLALQYSPIGFYFAENRPDEAIGFRKAGSGCIMPLVLKSANGATVAFDENTAGWACSAFFLGYRDRIFFGIEYFLSHGPVFGQRCERFIKTPKLARSYLKSMRFPEKSGGVAVFKPLERFTDSQQPELAIFFANADQLSALVYLLNFAAPLEEDRVVTGFASACGSIVSLPLRYARRGEKKAVWGLHDITARARLPKDLMTFTVPFALLLEMGEEIKRSFLSTERWARIAERCLPAPGRKNGTG